ncbi:MAG: transcriptional regulator [Verrucomicrobiota bacterium]
MEDKPTTPQQALTEARDEFVAQWGAIGGTWGINRTMAQIHALLLSSPQPLSTDEVMADLRISRGNANTNLRDLVGWGLIRSVIRKGERKEYFEADKDVWRMFCTIARERKRREFGPAIEVLDECKSQTQKLKTPEAKEFNKLMGDIGDIMKLGDRVLESIAGSAQNKFMKWAQKLFT